MKTKLKLLAIPGSTRKTSSNHQLINAIKTLASDEFDLTIFEGIATLPHFNPDIDTGTAPEPVSAFRKQLGDADAILICTPEYAIGVPGTLKNAIDWTVSSMEFSKKPVALITASLAGTRAHNSLMGTLLIIESKMTAATQMVISGIKAKINAAGEISDPPTLENIKNLVHALAALVNNDDGKLLKAPELFQQNPFM